MGTTLAHRDLCPPRLTPCLPSAESAPPPGPALAALCPVKPSPSRAAPGRAVLRASGHSEGGRPASPLQCGLGAGPQGADTASCSSLPPPPAE